MNRIINSKTEEKLKRNINIKEQYTHLLCSFLDPEISHKVEFLDPEISKTYLMSELEKRLDSLSCN